jgi:hypothetical protein
VDFEFVPFFEPLVGREDLKLVVEDRGGLAAQRCVVRGGSAHEGFGGAESAAVVEAVVEDPDNVVAGGGVVVFPLFYFERGEEGALDLKGDAMGRPEEVGDPVDVEEGMFDEGLIGREESLDGELGEKVVFTFTVEAASGGAGLVIVVGHSVGAAPDADGAGAAAASIDLFFFGFGGIDKSVAVERVECHENLLLMSEII